MYEIYHQFIGKTNELKHPAPGLSGAFHALRVLLNYCSRSVFCLVTNANQTPISLVTEYPINYHLDGLMLEALFRVSKENHIGENSINDPRIAAPGYYVA